MAKARDRRVIRGSTLEINNCHLMNRAFILHVLLLREASVEFREFSRSHRDGLIFAVTRI